VGVRIDAHDAAKFESTTMPTPIEIELPRIGVDLDPETALGAS
jgi:hypothetical protein